MKTKLIILSISLFFSLTISSQRMTRSYAANDVTFFTGTWVATQGDMKYEITFAKGIREFDDVPNEKYIMEALWGSVKWYKNGVLIRETKVNDEKVILSGIISKNDPLFLSIVCNDKENKFIGTGYFKINDAKNPQKAMWYFSISKRFDKQAKNDFPPSQTEFIKK